MRIDLPCIIKLKTKLFSSQTNEDVVLKLCVVCWLIRIEYVRYDLEQLEPEI